MKSPVLFVGLILILAGCALEEETGFGRIKLQVFDSPPPSGVEHIYLTITDVHVSTGDDEWIPLAQPETRFDFLDLVNGATAVLVDDAIEPGTYAQLRLIVSDSNEIVIDGQSYPLRVPSGEQTGVKLNLDFTVEEDELVEILIDFDASQSITWTPGNYQLRPSFKALKKVVSGTVSGTVTDTAGAAIVNALVEATGTSESFATVSDSLGSYTLIVVEGIYDVEGSAQGYVSSDTVYSGISVEAESDLTGYDFVLD
ncbi:MAG: DUF4382 domain-containing protein [Fidelibacterota bacterium]